MASTGPNIHAPWHQPGHQPAPPQVSNDMDEDMDDVCLSFSRILLKGERYEAPAGLQSAELLEEWGWHGSAHEYSPIRYLDASCLVFGPGQQFLEAVDYQRKQSSSLVGEPGAVSHSGDQLDEVARAGRHTISLNLAKLQPGVSELFMTLSSYGPARLSDILRPSVAMINAVSKEPLCAYQLEEQPAEQLQHCTSVIMCRVHRTRDGWGVEALGQLGTGNASNYAPIVEYVKNALPLADALSKWGF